MRAELVASECRRRRQHEAGVPRHRRHHGLGHGQESDTFVNSLGSPDDESRPRTHQQAMPCAANTAAGGADAQCTRVSAASVHMVSGSFTLHHCTRVVHCALQRCSSLSLDERGKNSTPLPKTMGTSSQSTIRHSRRHGGAQQAAHDQHAGVQALN